MIYFIIIKSYHDKYFYLIEDNTYWFLKYLYLDLNELNLLLQNSFMVTLYQNTLFFSFII